MIEKPFDLKVSVHQSLSRRSTWISEIWINHKRKSSRMHCSYEDAMIAALEDAQKRIQEKLAAIHLLGEKKTRDEMYLFGCKNNEGI